jgi:hypothetical protein
MVAVVSSHRSAERRRSSTPASSPLTSNTWAYATPSTGLRWQVLEQKGQGIVNRFGIKDVVVVKDQDDMVWEGGDVVE